MRRLTPAAVPLSLVAAGLLVRLSSWTAVFQDGRVLFVDVDDHLHLRRMMTAAELFPRLPAVDRLIGYPDAASFRWPPLYDWACGGLLRLLGLSTPEAAAKFAAFVPAVLGAATLWVFWKLCESLMERRAALWALAGAAVLPQAVFYTLLGRPDHHCVENLLLAAAFLAEVRGRHALTALALAAGTWCFVGFPAFGVLIWAWRLTERKREAAAAFFLQVPLLLPGALGAASRGGLFAFDTLSLFQPLAALMLGLWLLAACEAKERPKLSGALALAGFVLGMALARLSTESIALFTAGAPAPFAGFTELQPLRPLSLLGFLGLLPLAAPLAWRKAPLPVKVWTAGTAALALLQARYSLHLTLALCALLAPLAANFAWAAVLLASPALFNTAKLPLVKAALVGTSDLAQASEFLREKTPRTRSVWGNEGTPEYGVYAHLGLGAELAARAQRPVPAANVHWLEKGIERSLALFAFESAEEGERFLRLHGLRYVVLDPSPAKPDSLAARLYLHDGALARRADGTWAAPVDFARLVFQSRGPATVKVFEVVDGAYAQGTCRSAREPVVAEVTLEPSGGEPRVWRTFSPCERGRYRLRLPYPGKWLIREGGKNRGLFIETSSSKRL